MTGHNARCRVDADELGERRQAAAIPYSREGDIDMAGLPKVSVSQMKLAVLDSDALLALAIQLTG